jgi:hypothetical protein
MVRSAMASPSTVPGVVIVMVIPAPEPFLAMMQRP